MPYGWLIAVGIRNPPNTPLVVIRPIMLPPNSVYHRFPSGPAVMPYGPPPTPGTGNSLPRTRACADGAVAPTMRKETNSAGGSKRIGRMAPSSRTGGQQDELTPDRDRGLCRNAHWAGCLRRVVGTAPAPSPQSVGRSAFHPPRGSHVRPHALPA